MIRRAVPETDRKTTWRPAARQPDVIKNAICIWYNKNAEAAAKPYAATFRDSAVTTLLLALSEATTRAAKKLPR